MYLLSNVGIRYFFFEISNYSLLFNYSLLVHNALQERAQKFEKGDAQFSTSNVPLDIK